MNHYNFQYEPSVDMVVKGTLTTLPNGSTRTNEALWITAIQNATNAFNSALTAAYPVLGPIMSTNPARIFVIDGNLNEQTYINLLNKNPLEFLQFFTTDIPVYTDLTYYICTITPLFSITGADIPIQNEVSKVVFFYYD